MSKRLLFCGRNILTQVQVLKYSSAAAKQTPAEYCVELLRKYDYENFLCTLLLPRKIRAAAFAIRAFNVEIAQIQDQVHEYKLGEMRLKFWTDSLNSTYKGNPPRNPVMLELDRILQKHSLNKYYLKRLIDSRLERLSDYQFIDMAAIEKYAEYSTSSIYYLLLEAHGIKSIDADHAASHMGKAHGIVNLIRSVPYNARKRVNMLPQDILMKHNVATEDVFQGYSSMDLQNVIYDVASSGKLHLDTAISLKGKLEKEISPIFLPIICVQAYLDQLRKVDFNIFDKKLYRRNDLLPLILLWKKWTH